LVISTSFYHQVDSQVVKVNLIIEQFLRLFIINQQRSWHILLDIAEFVSDLYINQVIEMSLFEVHLGYILRLQFCMTAIRQIQCLSRG
jgi:hypothetical protein